LGLNERDQILGNVSMRQVARQARSVTSEWQPAGSSGSLAPRTASGRSARPSCLLSRTAGGTDAEANRTADPPDAQPEPRPLAREPLARYRRRQREHGRADRRCLDLSPALGL